MFRKDRETTRPARPKSAQRDDGPKLGPAGPNRPNARAGASAPVSGAGQTPDADLPGVSAARAPWPRPMPGTTPNRLTALLGEPVTRPVSPVPEQTISEPRRETGKRMHIGQDISISGEITTCDVLVIDGHVDATVRDCGRLEIGPAGTLRGDVEVRNAEIGGHFDGELKVSDRLTVRGGGRVCGIIRYGRLEVTVGGELRGDVAPAAEEQAQDRDPAAETGEQAAEPAPVPERPSAASILQPKTPDDGSAVKADAEPAPAGDHDEATLADVADGGPDRPGDKPDDAADKPLAGGRTAAE